MDLDELQRWRQERLAALAKKRGGNTELGKELGYKNGAFVGQMIKGWRPITEKTILLAEDLPGCAGWFDPPLSAKGHTSTSGKAELSTEAPADNLIFALNVVAKAVQQANKFDREALVPLFSNLVMSPENVATISHTISNILRRGESGGDPPGEWTNAFPTDPFAPINDKHSPVHKKNHHPNKR